MPNGILSMKKLLWLGLIFPVMLYAADQYTAPIAESQPLRIAISSFTPPFVMQSSYNQFYGFDIAMIEYVCTALQRRCQYVPMHLDEILPAINNRSVDLAVSSIVIKPSRSRVVLFSIPYMISQGQFIGGTALTKQTVNSQVLTNKKIGVVRGSVYEDQIKLMEINQLRVVPYQSGDQMIAALKSGYIDLGFLDSHTAQYWQDNSSGSLHTLGKSFPVGFGLGIMASSADIGLIQAVDIALLRYQNSADFKTNYNLYLSGF